MKFGPSILTDTSTGSKLEKILLLFKKVATEVNIEFDWTWGAEYFAQLVREIPVLYTMRGFMRLSLISVLSLSISHPFILILDLTLLLAVPWLRRLVADFPPWRPGFEPRSGHVRSVVDKVALVQVFSDYFDFPCQFPFHKLLHIHP
jgi:hypothetical protein